MLQVGNYSGTVSLTVYLASSELYSNSTASELFPKRGYGREPFTYSTFNVQQCICQAQSYSLKYFCEIRLTQLSVEIILDQRACAFMYTAPPKCAPFWMNVELNKSMIKIAVSKSKLTNSIHLRTT